MNRYTDIVLGTQLSMTVTSICVYLAHLIDAEIILNPNWHWMVYVLLVIAVFMVLLPHILEPIPNKVIPGMVFEDEYICTPFHDKTSPLDQFRDVEEIVTEDVLEWPDVPASREVYPTLNKETGRYE